MTGLEINHESKGKSPEGDRALHPARILRTQLAKALTGSTGFDEITGGGLPRALSSLQLKAPGLAGGYLLAPVSGGSPAFYQSLVRAQQESEQTC